jgi:hypothetical protein
VVPWHREGVTGVCDALERRSRQVVEVVHGAWCMEAGGSKAEEMLLDELRAWVSSAVLK